MSKVMKALSTFFKNLWHDIRDRFKYKPWTVCTLLFMVPGLIIGLFLGEHYIASSALSEEYSYSGVALFGLVLLGCINIFNAFSFAAKRSLGMAIFSTIVSILLCAVTAYYCNLFIQAQNASETQIISSETIVSMGVCVVSAICSLAASILTYFFIDKDRVKD